MLKINLLGIPTGTFKAQSDEIKYLFLFKRKGNCAARWYL